MNVDLGIDTRSRGGGVCVECDLSNFGRGDGLEDRLEPGTWLPEPSETKLDLFQACAWRQIDERRFGSAI